MFKVATTLLEEIQGLPNHKSNICDFLLSLMRISQDFPIVGEMVRFLQWFTAFSDPEDCLELVYGPNVFSFI